MAIFTAIAAAVGAVATAVGAIGGGLAAAGAATGLGTAGLVSAGIGAVGLGVTGYLQYQGMKDAEKANKRMAAAQRQAEALRKQQSQLEINNAAIQNIRKAQLTRAQNLVRSTAQTGAGAQFGSALANTTGSVETALGYQLDTTGQAGSIGFGIFNANAQYSDAASNKAIASGISSLGQNIAGALPSIERIGTYAVGRAIGGYDQNNWTTTVTPA